MQGTYVLYYREKYTVTDLESPRQYNPISSPPLLSAQFIPYSFLYNCFPLLYISHLSSFLSHLRSFSWLSLTYYFPSFLLFSLIPPLPFYSPSFPSPFLSSYLPLSLSYSLHTLPHLHSVSCSLLLHSPILS
jgi:hypothetical protein